LALSGCSGTEVLDTGNEFVQVDVRVVNNSDIALEFPPDGGGSLVKVSDIVLRPLDPVDEASLGTSPIAVFGSQRFIDVDLSSSETFSQAFQISTGSYLVDFIEFRDVQAQAAQELARCEDGTTVCVDTSQCTGIGGGACVTGVVVCGTGGEDGNFNWRDQEPLQFRDAGVLTVTGNDDRLNITLDGRVLLDALIASHAPEPDCVLDHQAFEDRLGEYVSTDLD